MAENKLLDLAQTVMLEKYGLDEMEYSIVSFSEGNKAVSIKMSDGWIPVSASFPREFLKVEEMKRWDHNKKVLYLKYLENEGHELPEELADSFHHAMLEAEGMGPRVVHIEEINGESVFKDWSPQEDPDVTETPEEPAQEMADPSNDAEEASAEDVVEEKPEKVVKKPKRRLKKAQ